MTPICRSCQAPIYWAVVANSGKRMPLDVAPVDDPKSAFIIARGQDPGDLIAISASWFRAGGEPLLTPMPSLHRSHFASCPDAAKHRRTA